MSTATAETTVVRPVDVGLREAVRLALGFAAVKFVLHAASNLWQAHIGYGYFRDEMYYIVCGQRLAWGYVDHGPGVAVQARLALALFGRSLAGIRMLSAAAGAGMVFMTGLLAWALGGRRPAQGLAMLGVLISPQYLGTDGYLSMNSVEPLFWMGSLLALVLLARGGSDRLWIWFGALAGLGLLNKPSMTFFLVALLLGMLVTPARRLLWHKWAAVGVLLTILIALPNLIWQIHNHWPTLEFLHNGQVENKNIKLGPVAFVPAQVKQMNPLTALVWGAGLVSLLRGKNWRWIGLMYCFFLAIMMALHAKDYYVAPVYPVLFAAGGIAWERRFAGSRGVARARAFAFPVMQTAMVLTALLLLPLSMPLMPPEQWLAYTKATHLYGQNSNTENEGSGPLPQFYADRFGWQEEVDQVERVYAGLSAEDKAKVGILCSNYGEASAINFLGHGLPFASSVQNNYWIWGPQGATGEVMILINGYSLDEMREMYGTVEIVGRMDGPYSMPFEHRNIYLARGRKGSLLKDWPEMKNYI
jgi:hypothetical protein